MRDKNDRREKDTPYHLWNVKVLNYQADVCILRRGFGKSTRPPAPPKQQSERSENILELVMRLFEDPSLDVNTAAEWLNVEYSTANRLIGQLEDDGILEELTGKERNRFYRASELFKIINKPIDRL
ncbi:hypothetical protein HYG81_22385 (plasmid) [Natrinema zhouii]|uniref:hypothetical protein n=1 Tax=Natrinema zhouii TaxID=1710539 RepID=UPI001D001752|nr:hypothetical protein [Natrinema zhouii]UHQ98715.1 hypothetical protein HYG81_22385 [Natrinema zhouii]